MPAVGFTGHDYKRYEDWAGEHDYKTGPSSKW